VSTVQGSVAAGFEPVAAQFEENLRTLEVGAAFAVFRHGEPVVDLWGGLADAGTGEPWQRDTSARIFSGSKGVIAATLARLCTLGVLDLDKPVSHYWPEFAVNGKDETTLSECVTYSAGLPALTEPVSQEELGDAREMARRVAQEMPVQDSVMVYGPFTMGWIVDEVVLRATGATLREFFREQIAARCGIDFGWPPEQTAALAAVHYDDAFTRQYDKLTDSPDLLTRRIWANPVPFPHGRAVWDEPHRLHSYVPAANGAGTARSIARLYAILLEDLSGHSDIGSIASQAVMERAIEPSVRAVDPPLGFPFCYGAGGFRRRGTPRAGIDGDMFGHDGGGGSAHFAWPAAGIALSYTPNRLLDIGNDDHRASSLIRSLKSCLMSVEASPRRARAGLANG